MDKIYKEIENFDVELRANIFYLITNGCEVVEEVAVKMESLETEVNDFIQNKIAGYKYLKHTLTLKLGEIRTIQFLINNYIDSGEIIDFVKLIRSCCVNLDYMFG